MISPEAVRREFDAKARTYERGRLGGWYKAQAALALERARLHAGDAVLDVGCGTGWLLRRIGARYSRIRGLGLDLSPEMIGAARERTRIEAVDGLTFIAGDWTGIDPHLLLSANGIDAADLVCCVSSFHYFPDPEGALEKMFSVTRAGGRLLLLDRARDRSPATFVWDLVHRGLLRDTVRFYRSDELLELVRGAGYEDAAVVDSVRRLFWKGKLATSVALIAARKP